MKKALSLILALVMCLSLCACGGNEDGTAVEEQKKYSVNETAISSRFECSLKQVSFAERVEVGDYSSGYMLPATEDTTISRPAKSGSVLLCFTANLKYTGTTTIQNMCFGNGSSAIGFYATYDTEYKYTTFVASRYENFGWERYVIYDGRGSYDCSFTPLSNDTLTVRAYIELPAVVAENTDKPLDITINLGSDEAVTFSINP